MKLLIEKCGPKDLKLFIKDFVIPMATEIFISLVDRRRYSLWENYLQKLYRTKRQVNVDKILMQGISNLEFYRRGNDYELSINSNIICSEIPAKLIDVCALINYGNLEINPYPIFDVVMERLGLELPDLYLSFTLTGGA